ncbi:hypothetical protein GCM10010960_16840 [Arenimonas maotaiensis]|uniref:Mitomycin resistance protein n=1 Tax=Arenimonas maotaiensis TaxID=1446479 RepID=A0A917FPF4_9GAMM|nr:helix-hairpin-helix domain-containing protein [Arenimonas maotaiensis]GGF95819.1 hypothetical protein GCM10010960_16840 [Arenimonas maotaiensis]
MNPAKVRRDRLEALTDLPNIGPSMAGDLRLLGLRHPRELAGQDAFKLYRRLCELTGCRQDPCVLDTLLSVVDFADGGDAKPWWHYTEQRKARWPSL